MAAYPSNLLNIDMLDAHVHSKPTRPCLWLHLLRNPRTRIVAEKHYSHKRGHASYMLLKVNPSKCAQPNPRYLTEFLKTHWARFQDRAYICSGVKVQERAYVQVLGSRSLSHKPNVPTHPKPGPPLLTLSPKSMCPKKYRYRLFSTPQQC
jgi:hypothetical protein